MRIETVLVFELYDLDFEKQQLSGMSAMVLNLFDRIEFSSMKSVVIPKRIFADLDWFTQLTEIVRGAI
jgi:hypothetical protein